MTKQQKDRVQILAVSVDNHEESKKFGEMLRQRFEGEFDFPLLEDKDHKVIDRYGVLNPDSKGWPQTAQLATRGGVWVSKGTLIASGDHESVFNRKGVSQWSFIAG